MMVLAGAFSGLCQTSPDNAGAVADLIARAGQHHEHSEWKAAVADATAALKIDPNSAQAYNIRGDALAQLREFDRAIADLTQAIQLDPQMRVAYINRGAAYEGGGRDDLALADYETATTRYPDWEVGHRLRYEILLKHGRYSEAIPSLTKRSEILPQHVYILMERAEAYRAMNDFEHALADYSEAIKRSPKDGRFWHGRAKLYLARGDKASALSDLNAAIEVAPNAPDLYIDRAKIYRARGDLAAAQADETRARNVPKNWPDPAEFMLFVALGLLLGWPKMILCPLAAIFIRPRVVSMAAAFAVGAVEAAWPMWTTIISLDDLGAAAAIIGLFALSGLGGLFWWGIARAASSRFRRRPPAAGSPPAGGAAARWG
jgi:tetratricopeptide (TPR) repeat protein